MPQTSAASDLHVLQSQVFSRTSPTRTKLRPPSGNRREDTQNAFHRHVYVDVHVRAAGDRTSQNCSCEPLSVVVFTMDLPASYLPI